MDELKYIVIDHQGFELPIVFPALLDHKTVANTFMNEYSADRVISAGFCSITPNGDELNVSAWGKSTTLNIFSRPEDAAVIKTEMNRPLNN